MKAIENKCRRQLVWLPYISMRETEVSPDWVP
jgi:hypothetical protein